MLDRCGLLKQAWYAAALTAELKPGRPIARAILEQPLVLWRTRNGKPVAMEDRCAHRNAPLSEGKVFDRGIACPYHGWSYDAAGKCVEVPSQGRDEAAPACQVPTFPVIEQHGLLWIWMGDGAPARQPYPIANWDSPGWRGYYMVTEFANEVTHLVENFMDVPHTTFVHHGWFRRPAQRRVRVLVERTPDSVLVTYDQPDDQIGFAARMLNPEGAPMEHTDRFFMPSTTRVDYRFGPARGFSIMSTCTPRGPFDTIVYTWIGYSLGWLNVLGPLWLPSYTRKVITQDVDIMRLQGDNLKRFGGQVRFQCTNADRLHEFVESLRDHAESGGRGPAPEPRVDEVYFWI